MNQQDSGHPLPLDRDAKLLIYNIYYYVLFLLIMAAHSESFMK